MSAIRAACSSSTSAATKEEEGAKEVWLALAVADGTVSDGGGGMRLTARSGDEERTVGVSNSEARLVLGST
jgi:hypothetical protein